MAYLEFCKMFDFFLTLDTRGIGGSLDPRDLIGRIYVGDHQTLLDTKYISCGPHGFRNDFPIISLWELYVAMATRVPTQISLKSCCLMTQFLH